MKALTVRQPWAAMLVSGRKRVEWRQWATTHRGPLAIHAAARVQASIPTPRGLRALASVRGAIVGEVTITSCELCPCGCGWWAWTVEDAVAYVEPVPATGRLGLWEAA